MARRDDTGLSEEKRSYGALWLVLSLFLFVCGLWTIADDNFFRRPWKKYQAEFNRLDIQRAEAAIATEQARLDADSNYQTAAKEVDAARKEIESGESPGKLAAPEHQLELDREADLTKDLNLRFVKAELEELRFKYDDAHHTGKPTDDIQKQIDEREKLRAERQEAYSKSQEGIEAIEKQIKDKRGRPKQAEEARASLTTR